MQLLNIRFTFSLRTSHQNQDGKSAIVLRVSFRGERRDIFTGLYCLELDWDRSATQVAKSDKRASAVNKNLGMILQSAKNSFDELKFSRETFTIGDLMEKIKGKEDSPTLLIDYLKDGSKSVLKRVGSEITRPTYNKYNRAILYMQEFLEAEYKVKNFSLQKLNTTFIEKYFQFLRNEKNIGHNTACKYLACVKTILVPAIREGLVKPDPFYGFRITSKPVFRGFLSQEEIDKISSVQLDDPDLDRKRDIFLFACYTGLAYVDLQQLNSRHLLKETNSWYIRKPRQKTGQDSIIPLLPAAIRILTKYSPNGNIADFNWYVSSNQKMNKGLKYIAKRAGISKDLHMHLARHTFATTVTLANGVPIESVSKMLGHANINQTQHYAKVLPMKIKLDMEKIKDLFK
ncbi:MAG: site-specific integrase [Chitinophagaceae bacterium]